MGEVPLQVHLGGMTRCDASDGVAPDESGLAISDPGLVEEVEHQPCRLRICLEIIGIGRRDDEALARSDDDSTRADELAQPQHSRDEPIAGDAVEDFLSQAVGIRQRASDRRGVELV